MPYECNYFGFWQRVLNWWKVTGSICITDMKQWYFQTRRPDTRLHMGIINRVMEDTYNEFSKRPRGRRRPMETGRFEHIQTLSRLQEDSDESDSEVYEIYPSAMNSRSVWRLTWVWRLVRATLTAFWLQLNNPNPGAGSIILITLTAFRRHVPR
jgi:hypothetical protein